MIPEEAVEAATQGIGKMIHTRDFQVMAEAALKAAAPIIRAQAFKEVADECDRTSSNILNNNQSLNPAWDGMAEGWKNAATRLRARASTERPTNAD